MEATALNGLYGVRVVEVALPISALSNVVLWPSAGLQTDSIVEFPVRDNIRW